VVYTFTNNPAFNHKTALFKPTLLRTKNVHYSTVL
jgi:hypothetical protein